MVVYIPPNGKLPGERLTTVLEAKSPGLIVCWGVTG